MAKVIIEIKNATSEVKVQSWTAMKVHSLAW